MQTQITHIPVVIMALYVGTACANPILNNTDPGFLYAADPAAEVFNGKVYVYCSRDQPDATDYSSMQDYMILESSDMTNWVNHGVVLEPRTAEGFEYASGQMNAPDAAYKDGWYYWYFPFDKTYVGVAKSVSPEGPWETAVTGSITTIFDPTVFVDDDGQAYIYGNDHKVDIGDSGWHLMGGKLKDNMIELDGDWFRLSEEEVNEAVHIFKRNGIYYFSARKGTTTDYWMADNPLPYPGNPDNLETPVYSDPSGYASYRGVLAPSAPDAPNHASAIEFNEKWWFFYQRGDVNDGTSVRRSSCVDEMVFNADGTIQQIVYTLESDEPVDPRGNGSMSQEAEDFSDQSGIVAEECTDFDGGEEIGLVESGDWSAYTNIYFGNDTNGTIPFYFRASSKTSGGEIELRLGSETGDVIGTVNIPGTGGWDSYTTVTGSVAEVSGTNDLYMVYSGDSGYLFNLNWFEWTPAVTQQVGLVAEWTFDEQTLANTGSSGSIHDAVFMNSTGDDIYSTNTFSGFGYSLKLDSIADGYSITPGGEFLKIGNSASSDTGYINTFDINSFTVSMWIKTDGDWSRWDEFGGKGSEAEAAGWALRAREFGTDDQDGVRFTSYSDDATARDGDPYDVDLEDQEWHLMTASYDGATVNIYLDTNLVATASGASIEHAVSQPLVFGARSDGSRGENILIDQIQFYNGTLTAQQVADLFLDTGNYSPSISIPSMSVSNGTVNVQFEGATGQHYRVEYAGNLIGGDSWQVVTDIVSLAISPVDVIAPMTNNAGFYRVLWLP